MVVVIFVVYVLWASFNHKTVKLLECKVLEVLE